MYVWFEKSIQNIICTKQFSEEKKYRITSNDIWFYAIFDFSESNIRFFIWIGLDLNITALTYGRVMNLTKHHFIK